MSPNPRPTAAERQQVRALALNAAAMLVFVDKSDEPIGAGTFDDPTATLEPDNYAELRKNTMRLMSFIETGRWPE